MPATFMTTGSDVASLIAKTTDMLARLDAAIRRQTPSDVMLTSAVAVLQSRLADVRDLYEDAKATGAPLGITSVYNSVEILYNDSFTLGGVVAQTAGGVNPVAPLVDVSPGASGALAGSLDKLVTAAVWLGGAYLAYKIIVHFSDHGAYPRERLPRYAGGE